MDHRQNNRQRNADHDEPKSEFDQITVQTRRVTKVTQGAKRFRFSSIVVIGNRKGLVGAGIGKGSDPKSAIDKAAKNAKQNLIPVTMKGTTIPHVIEMDFGASKVLLKPAAAGTGIIAGSSVRAVVELAGIKDIRGKILGSNNKVNNVYCTIKALSLLRDGRL